MEGDMEWILGLVAGAAPGVALADAAVDPRQLGLDIPLLFLPAGGRQLTGRQSRIYWRRKPGLFL